VQRISDMRPFLFKNSTTLNNFFMGIKPSATSMVATRGQMKTMMAEGGVPAANPLAQATPEQQVMEQGEVEHEAMEQETPDGPPSGVIGSENVSPEDSIADDVPMEVPEGAFIINAAAAEVAGYGDIKKMIMNAIGVAKRLGIEIAAGNNETSEEEAVDLLVSKGEVYIEPTLAKIIGYDVLEKINNRGKKEVARRQQEAAAAEEQQAAPAPQAPQAPMQRGGFVKKKLADGGYTQSLTSNDVAERVASAIGVREDAQYAKDLSRLESSRQQFDDDDKSEDTLRHILLGGLVSPTNKDTLLGKAQGFLGSVGIEARERKNFIGDYINEESAIDANNNKYGAALRKRYKTQEEFEQAAIDAVIALREGKPIEIDGLTPRMSFGNPPKEESSRASQGN